jgi:hypothetical protein
LPVLLLVEAVAAIYRAVTPGLERYGSLDAALGADNLEHLPRLRGISTLTLLAASYAAFRTASGFVLESMSRIKLLLTNRKSEFFSAVSAN